MVLDTKLKLIIFGLIGMTISWLAYDGLESILGSYFGTISPFLKLATAIVLAFVGLWKIGG